MMHTVNEKFEEDQIIEKLKDCVRQVTWRSHQTISKSIQKRMEGDDIPIWVRKGGGYLDIQSKFSLIESGFQSSIKLWHENQIKTIMF